MSASSPSSEVIVAPSVVESGQIDDHGVTANGAQDEEMGYGDYEEYEEHDEAFESEEGSECVICLTAAVNAKMLPCEHAHFCMDCAGLIFAGAVDREPRCPVCRTEITGISEIVAEEARDQEGERREARRNANPYAIILQAHRRGSASQLAGAIPAPAAVHHGIPGLSLASSARSSTITPMTGRSTVAPTLATMSNTTQQQDAARQMRRAGKGKGQGKSKHSRREDRHESANAGGHFPWWPADHHETDAAYITLPLGDEIGLLPDTGAHDNLCGEHWARRLADRCKRAGVRNLQYKLQARAVQGVGGQQTATAEVDLATATLDVEGRMHTNTYRAPCLDNSNVPGLLGIKALKHEDALIRCSTGEMWFLGQGGVDMKVSPGTRHFQMREAPGGHWMLPVSQFFAPQPAQSSGAPPS